MNEYVPNGFFSPQNPTTPTAFSDGYSYGEEVRKLITYVNGLYSEYVKVDGSNEALTKQYQTLINTVNQFQTTLNAYISGNTIPDHSVSLIKLSNDIMTQLESWVESCIYEQNKFVSFGINDDGYFYVAIPKSWKDVRFSTNETGCLVLEF